MDCVVALSNAEPGYIILSTAAGNGSGVNCEQKQKALPLLTTTKTAAIKISS
jgi:hypothetical protein